MALRPVGDQRQRRDLARTLEANLTLAVMSAAMAFGAVVSAVAHLL